MKASSVKGLRSADKFGPTSFPKETSNVKNTKDSIKKPATKKSSKK